MNSSPKHSPRTACPLEYYSEWQGEEHRLFIQPSGIVERLRTQSILKRFLPDAPVVIYDIGGGAGVYAFPLAEDGHHVHLIDLTPRHIELAVEHMTESGISLAECAVGDARQVAAPDQSADAVLLLGPLYHLKNQDDRHKALQEAYRILKPGGQVYAIAISRFAVYHDFGSLNELHDPHVAALSKDVLQTGQNHQPEDPARDFFSYCTFFHHPDELEQEVTNAGFNKVKMLSVEGPSWLFAGLKDTVKDAEALQAALQFIELIESERSIMGASGHIMAIGTK